MHGWCYAVKPEKMHECIRIFKEVNAPSIAARPGSIGHRWVDQTSDQATCVPFWKNEADEEASRANIPRLGEGISHVLASGEAYQETFEVVHEQHPTEHLGVSKPYLAGETTPIHRTAEKVCSRKLGFRCRGF